MFNESNVKSLAIVYTQEVQKYASYLMQLIGTNDDEGDNIVGIKDGSVQAVLWKEKDYEDNRPQFTSFSHVLFIGNSKYMQQERFGMQSTFNQYGMKFDALGKRAAMYVEDKALKQKEYDGFVEFCKNYGKIVVEKYSPDNKAIDAAISGAGAAVGATGAAIGTAASAAGAAVTHLAALGAAEAGTTFAATTGTALTQLAASGVAFGAAGAGTTVGMATALAALGPIALAGAGTAVAAGAVKKIWNSVQRKAKIQEEQYKFLVFYSYMELLTKYLEG